MLKKLHKFSKYYGWTAAIVYCNRLYWLSTDDDLLVYNSGSKEQFRLLKQYITQCFVFSRIPHKYSDK